MDLIIQQLQDQIFCLIDSITCTVDAQVIVIRLAPVGSTIEVIILSVLAVHLLQEADSLLHIHLSYIHDMLDTDGKRRRDKQADMWNVIVLQDRIRTSSHDDAVLF